MQGPWNDAITMKAAIGLRMGVIGAVIAGSIGLSGAQVIRIKGSDTLGAKLVPAIAEKYQAGKNPRPEFEISAEGSSVAFPALTNGTADIGMSSRKASAGELAAAQAKGVKLTETVACHDMIVVVVNKSSKVKNLSKEQIMKIFTGATKDWSEVGGSPGPISVYTRNTSSGTYKDWQKLAMGGRDYPSSSQKLAGNEQIVQEVAKNKNGIGYVGLAYAKANGIKAVSIDGTQPVANNAKKYAYSRLCYFYAPDKPSAEAQAFMDFVESGAGQAIVSRVGFIPTK